MVDHGVALRTSMGRVTRQRLVVLAASTVAALLLTVPAAAQPAGLPLGDPDLAETRTDEVLADGVTLTRIVRGTEPAPADQIPTTPRGPWRVNVLTIDADAPARLRSTYGPDIARTEPTSDLVSSAGAVAGVNASFFTFTADPAFPGDPVGLGIDDGRLVSEPTAAGDEVHLIVDDGQVRIDRLTWAGSVTHRETGDAVALEFVNHPPVVPAECAPLPDQRDCTAPGDVVRFTPDFAATTPAGPGIEIVLDGGGCVARSAPVRGMALGPEETSLQATGADVTALLTAAGRGCVDVAESLTGADGVPIELRPGLYAVNGRNRLTADGVPVVPPGTGSFFARNPRTIAGTTADGDTLLVTIDGRRPESVGTTLDETAAVAGAMGLTDAINLDGGGSTTMATGAGVINTPAGSAERAVGDALVVTGP